MKFLLDESVEFPLVTHLKELGHDVTAIARDYPQALKDREVLAIAGQEGRILITNDRDFGELIFRQGLPHSGVILFRVEPEMLFIGVPEELRTKVRLEGKIARLRDVLTNYADRLGDFLVVTERSVRIRRTRQR